jgi:hypothetical protein
MPAVLAIKKIWGFSPCIEKAAITELPYRNYPI